MKRSLKRILFVATIIILVYAATSCNLPIAKN